MKQTIEVEVAEREIAVFDGMVLALERILSHCKDKGIHEFERKDVKHLFRNESESARFGDWVWFGGLVYKKGKGHYGLNIERCEEFFRGERTIPLRILKKTYRIPKTNEYRTESDGTIKDIPSVLALLDNGEFKAKYHPAKVEAGTQALFG